MKKSLSFITILLAVLTGFVVLKFTNNYFLWLVSIIISTIVSGSLFRLVMHFLNKANRKKLPIIEKNQKGNKEDSQNNTGDGSVS